MPKYLFGNESVRKWFLRTIAVTLNLPVTLKIQPIASVGDTIAGGGGGGGVECVSILFSF